MRFVAPLAILLLAGCASTPTRVPKPAAPAPPPAERGALIGLSSGELIARFGKPQFEVREGAGLKLQFAAPGCVLDAYLYPPVGGPGAERVSHVDTRRASGDPLDQAACPLLSAGR